MNSFSIKVTEDKWTLEYTWSGDECEPDKFELTLPSSPEPIVLGFESIETIRHLDRDQHFSIPRSGRSFAKVYEKGRSFIFERGVGHILWWRDVLSVKHFQRVYLIADWMRNQPSVAEYMATPYTNDTEVKNA